MGDFKVIIPARYASNRLPGKPLRDLAGKPMLQHVYDRATESTATEVIIATDDQRIADAADEFGATVCMTADTHESGTERLAEVSRVLDWPDEQVVVNLQGDEPLMPPELIDQCAGLMSGSGVEMATLASPLASPDDFANPNVVKVLTDNAGNAIYFSRAAIPFSRGGDTIALAAATALHHHGIYAYRVGTLGRLIRAEPTAVERCERLEQLRALSLGIDIRVGQPARRPPAGVDTEEDLEAAARILAGMQQPGKQ
jgi:3-deoxy-manno-octulosonate cytidylyltransferase (CMP-KDO synthetase)